MKKNKDLIGIYDKIYKKGERKHYAKYIGEKNKIPLEEQMVLDAVSYKGKKVLDAGCGTGILSVLSGKLGASSITAYDSDEWVIDNTQENFKINDTEGNILVGTVQSLSFNTQFDIILANINKNILMMDIPFYAKLLKAKGNLLLSGFYQTDLHEIEQVASENGLQLVLSNTTNDWSMAQFLSI